VPASAIKSNDPDKDLGTLIQGALDALCKLKTGEHKAAANILDNALFAVGVTEAVRNSLIDSARSRTCPFGNLK
jgi:hypothetical protein